MSTGQELLQAVGRPSCCLSVVAQGTNDANADAAVGRCCLGCCLVVALLLTMMTMVVPLLDGGVFPGGCTATHHKFQDLNDVTSNSDGYGWMYRQINHHRRHSISTKRNKGGREKLDRTVTKDHTSRSILLVADDRGSSNEQVVHQFRLFLPWLVGWWREEKETKKKKK